MKSRKPWGSKSSPRRETLTPAVSVAGERHSRPATETRPHAGSPRGARSSLPALVCSELTLCSACVCLQLEEIKKGANEGMVIPVGGDPEDPKSPVVQAAELPVVKPPGDELKKNAQTPAQPEGSAVGAGVRQDRQEWIDLRNENSDFHTQGEELEQRALEKVKHLQRPKSGPQREIPVDNLIGQAAKTSVVVKDTFKNVASLRKYRLEQESMTAKQSYTLEEWKKIAFTVLKKPSDQLTTTINAQTDLQSDDDKVGKRQFFLDIFASDAIKALKPEQTLETFKTESNSVFKNGYPVKAAIDDDFTSECFDLVEDVIKSSMRNDRFIYKITTDDPRLKYLNAVTPFTTLLANHSFFTDKYNEYAAIFATILAMLFDDNNYPKDTSRIKLFDNLKKDYSSSATDTTDPYNRLCADLFLVEMLVQCAAKYGSDDKFEPEEEYNLETATSTLKDAYAKSIDALNNNGKRIASAFLRFMQGTGPTHIICHLGILISMPSVRNQYKGSIIAWHPAHVKYSASNLVLTLMVHRTGPDFPDGVTSVAENAAAVRKALEQAIKKQDSQIKFPNGGGMYAVQVSAPAVYENPYTDASASASTSSRLADYFL